MCTFVAQLKINNMLQQQKIQEQDSEQLMATGRTTRIVDAAIQTLFTKGKIDIPYNRELLQENKTSYVLDHDLDNVSDIVFKGRQLHLAQLINNRIISNFHNQNISVRLLSNMMCVSVPKPSLN